jgi:hypothetical protein
MASAAGGPTLVEFQNDRAVGHVLHMPHRPVVECGDFHHVTFRENKKAWAAPEGAAHAMKTSKSRSGYDAHRPEQH